MKLTSSSSTRRALALLTLASLSAAPLHAGGGANGTTRQLSFAADGSPLSSGVLNPAITPDGRFVAYATASPLVPEDDNGERDVYVLDRETGSLACASVNYAGVFGNGACHSPSISADGRWVTFVTQATDQIGFDLNGNLGDILVRDMTSNGPSGLQRISGANGGAASSNGNSVTPDISLDGRFITFASFSSNLVPGDTNGTWDIFVVDYVLDTMARVSTGVGGEANGASRRPSISGDGLYVSFDSVATNLVLHDLNGVQDVFVRSLEQTVPRLVSSPDGVGSGNGHSYKSSISADGERIAFLSDADNLVAGDTNAVTDAFVRNVVTGALERISVSPAGMPADGSTYGVDLAQDGRHATFISSATNLTGEITPHVEVFLRDLYQRRTWRVSRPDGADSAANSSSQDAVVSDAGAFVAFTSFASNLDVPDMNGTSDVFLRTTLADPRTYCEGTLTADGCMPSISSVGYPSATSAAGFEIRVDSVSPNKPSMLFYGLEGRRAAPFLGGTLCVQPPLRRTPVSSSFPAMAGACGGRIVFDMNAFAAGVLGGNPDAALSLVGKTVNAQFWGRDPQNMPHRVFLSDAIEFEVGP